VLPQPPQLCPPASLQVKGAKVPGSTSRKAAVNAKPALRATPAAGGAVASGGGISRGRFGTMSVQSSGLMRWAHCKGCSCAGQMLHYNICALLLLQPPPAAAIYMWINHGNGMLLLCHYQLHAHGHAGCIWHAAWTKVVTTVAQQK
jgi:hypothetical protein